MTTNQVISAATRGGAAGWPGITASTPSHSSPATNTADDQAQRPAMPDAGRQLPGERGDQFPRPDERLIRHLGIFRHSGPAHDRQRGGAIGGGCHVGERLAARPTGCAA